MEHLAAMCCVPDVLVSGPHSTRCTSKELSSEWPQSSLAWDSRGCWLSRGAFLWPCPAHLWWCPRWCRPCPRTQADDLWLAACAALQSTHAAAASSFGPGPEPEEGIFVPFALFSIETTSDKDSSHMHSNCTLGSCCLASWASNFSLIASSCFFLCSFSSNASCGAKKNVTGHLQEIVQVNKPERVKSWM